MDIQLEDGSLRHLDELFEIEKQCFTSEAFSKQQISYLLTDFNSISLIAKVTGEIAGFVILQLENQDDTVFGHIITLNVASRYRRMGVAQRLLLECEVILKSRGVGECRLEVRQDNNAKHCSRRVGQGAYGLKGVYDACDVDLEHVDVDEKGCNTYCWKKQGFPCDFGLRYFHPFSPHTFSCCGRMGNCVYFMLSCWSLKM